MPSVSKAQQHFLGADLARKRAGEPTKTGMSEEQLKDFASTKTKGLPSRVSPAAQKIAAARVSRRRGTPTATRSTQAANAGHARHASKPNPYRAGGM